MAANISIKQLEILKFRGLKNCKFNPERGMNIVLGGGDTGKSTILDAIALLFSPTNSVTLSESDYWQRNVADGFTITATINVSEDFDFLSGQKVFWPWEWDGENPVLPNTEESGEEVSQTPVFMVSVSANEDFDVVWEVVQPNNERDHLPVGLRRKIGIVNLSSEDKNDRDLRLVYGSALDRLLSDSSLRSKLGNAISKYPLAESLSDEAKAALEKLDGKLAGSFLPNGLDIGIAGSQGISVGALISLYASKGETKLPMMSWGSGTRRLSALQIAALEAKNDEITLVDEIERGLEPHRLRQIINLVTGDERQSFITSHSSFAIGYAESAQLWFLDAKGCVGKLDGEALKKQRERDPEVFLSKVPIIVEGETEQGFVTEILGSALKADPWDMGIRVSLGQGDDQMLPVLEALTGAGLDVAGFADNDGKNAGRWQAVKDNLQDRLYRWDDGCIESNVISVLPEEYLPELLKDEDGDWDGDRLRTVADRLEIDNKAIEAITDAAEKQETDLRTLIIAAATGNTEGVEDSPTRKSWKKHSQRWFKRSDGSGGRELLHHLRNSSAWTNVEPNLRPFVNSILALVGHEALEEISL